MRLAILQVLKDIGGVELPDYLATFAAEDGGLSASSKDGERTRTGSVDPAILQRNESVAAGRPDDASS